MFKFHRSVKIDADATITVWSSDSNKEHEPPSNIVMKQQIWFSGDNTVTTVINSNGEEIAKLERVKNKFSSTSSRLRDLSSYAEAEEFLHQQGDPQNEDDRCSIM